MKIGIDIGGSHIAMGLLDENNNIIKRNEKRLMTKDKQNIIETIEDYIVKNVQELRKENEISEIGIGIPGTVDKTNIIKTVNLTLENYNIVENIKKYINLPITIRNDAKCAAIGEYTKGCLKGYNRSVFLTLGTGIGGAVIIDGKLLDTGTLPGCEFGHIIIEKDGKECKCGKKGCFQRYASMKVLKDNLRELLGLDEKTTGKELLEIIKSNKDNIEINNIIDEFIEYLSIGISNLINIFEPEVVGIGGSFVYFADILLEKLKTNIQAKNYLFNKREKLIIIPALLNNDAGIIGSCQSIGG